MPTKELGDWIGAPLHGGSLSRWRRRGGAAAARKDLPPPLMSGLARGTDDDLRSHVAWEMRSCRTSDGRLVIRQMRRRHYLVADRSNGRLVLNLVHVEDDDGVGETKEKISTETDGEDRASSPSECYSNTYNGAELGACGGFGAAAPVQL